MKTDDTEELKSHDICDPASLESIRMRGRLIASRVRARECARIGGMESLVNFLGDALRRDVLDEKSRAEILHIINCSDAEAFSFAEALVKGLRDVVRGELLLLSPTANTETSTQSSVQREELPQELPEKAPAIYADRHDKAQTIIDFLKIWKPWMDAKLLTRRDLRRLDPSADRAVERWIAKHPLPSEFYLPTVRQINDAILQADPSAIASSPRLAQIIAGRLRRQANRT